MGQNKPVRFVSGSQAHQIYGADEAVEVFACNYGLNDSFRNSIAGKEMRISGFDLDGTVRMVELPGHPFYIATLFVPQVLSSPDHPHPLILAYLNAAKTFQKSNG